MENVLVYIRKIDWMDKENPEADVLFQIHGQTFVAFSHPCYLAEGEVAKVDIDFLEEAIPETQFWNGNKAKEKKVLPGPTGTYSYYCYGQITRINPMCIDCGDVSFSYGDWVNDKAVIGSYVYFVIARLDITKAP